MPELSLFMGFGTMYYNDICTHFHAEYNGHKALVDINKYAGNSGTLPNKQLRLILVVCNYQDELMQNGSCQRT